MESIRISTVQYKKYVKRRVAVGARERERRKRLRVSKEVLPHSFCMGLKHAPIGPNAIAAPFSNNNLFLATHLWVSVSRGKPQVLQNIIFGLSTNIITPSLKVILLSIVLLATGYYSIQITFHQ
jgi:hypothetical protein